MMEFFHAVASTLVKEGVIRTTLRGQSSLGTLVLYESKLLLQEKKVRRNTNQQIRARLRKQIP